MDRSYGDEFCTDNDRSHYFVTRRTTQSSFAGTLETALCCIRTMEGNIPPKHTVITICNKKEVLYAGKYIG